MNPYSFAIGVVTGLLVSTFGVFVINRRLALAADAFSHVALPGVAIALLLGFNSTLGALVTLFFGAIIIHTIQAKTKLFPEILIGLVFSLSLAIGLLLVPTGDLESALLGDLGQLGPTDFAFGAIITLALLTIFIANFRRFTFTTFSETLAQVSGVKIERVNFMLLLGLVLAVALGIKVVGTLLVGSLLIIPPAAAQLAARNFRSLFAYAALYGALSVTLGILASTLAHLPPGPMVILFEGIFFLLSLALRGRSA